MKKSVMKHCKACEIKFDKLKKKPVQKEFELPKDIPVSDSMKRTIAALRKDIK